MIRSDWADEPKKQWLKTVDALQAHNNDLKEELSLVLRRQPQIAAGPGFEFLNDWFDHRYRQGRY